MHSIELLHPALPELIDALLRRKRWSWQALERGDLRIGDEVLDVDRLQWWLVNADPVLWVETNLVNKPEDGGGLWQLFPYQRPSLRFRGHVVHQDGAEVGKSREIVGLLLWGYGEPQSRPQLGRSPRSAGASASGSRTPPSGCATSILTLPPSSWCAASATPGARPRSPSAIPSPEAGTSPAAPSWATPAPPSPGFRP